MLWVLKTYVKTDGQENIYNFTLKDFVYLNLCGVASLKQGEKCYQSQVNWPPGNKVEKFDIEKSFLVSNISVRLQTDPIQHRPGSDFKTANVYHYARGVIEITS